jgi:hypothetical protein
MPDLKKLFEGVKHLSVSAFKERIAGLSPEEQTEYYGEVFRCALLDYHTYSKRYRTFFLHLVNAHRQEFLDFLHEKTILGDLRYPLNDRELFFKIVHLLERTNPDPEATKQALAFALLLSFDYDLKISSLQQYMKTQALDTADIADWVEMIHNS